MANPTARNSHTPAQKEFIVRQLASFEVPKDIAIRFAAVFPDTACNENDILGVDPRVTIVAPDLHALFYSERARIAADPAAAVYAEQNARLIVLSRDVDRLRGNNQPFEAHKVLRQIAEETGAIGPKAAGKAAAAPPPGEPVTEIVVTVVDPKVPA